MARDRKTEDLGDDFLDDIEAALAEDDEITEAEAEADETSGKFQAVLRALGVDEASV